VPKTKLCIRCFPDPGALAHEVTADVVARLARAIALRGQASLLVSGGRSPSALFERLHAQTLNWKRTWISLVDERWVSPSDAASNERLVRETLLQGQAAAARFVGLKNAASAPETGAMAAWSRLADLPRPVDVTILGMGDDGHTASLFPGAPNLPRALDRSVPGGCIAMCAPSEPHARLSLNLSALLNSRYILILILGEMKLRTYAAACASGPVEKMPCGQYCIRDAFRSRSYGRRSLAGRTAGGSRVSAVIDDNGEASVLADFDAGSMLDALSLAIIVLDEQLCAIYANAIAEDLLALHLPSLRGRPLAHFLPQPERFRCAVRRALRSAVAVDYTLRLGLEPWPKNADAINVRVAPLSNRMFGAYVLVEMSARKSVEYDSGAGP